MPALKTPPTGIQRSRRNLMKIGVIAASAMSTSLIKAKPVAARTGSPGPPGPPPPPRHLGCFLKGATIRTADGGRKIEDLAVGDLLPTDFGGVRPIHWIGRYPFKRRNPVKPWVKDVRPVRVARLALGPDVPHAANFAGYHGQHSPLTANEAPRAPLLRFDDRQSEIGSRLRSAISPMIDCRREWTSFATRQRRAGLLRCNIGLPRTDVAVGVCSCDQAFAQKHEQRQSKRSRCIDRKRSGPFGTTSRNLHIKE